MTLKQTTASRRAVIQLLGATFIWGATFVVIRDTVAHVDPAALVLARFALAAPLLFVIALLTRRPFTRAAWLGGSLSGVVAALAFALQAKGLTVTPAGTSAFLTSLGSLFAGVFAWPLLGQRPRVALVAGMLVAGAGTWLLTGMHSLSLGAGEVVTIIGALAFGLQVVVLAKFSPRADPLALVAVQALALAVAVAPFGALRLDQARVSRELMPGLAYLVIGGSIVAPLLQVLAQRALSAGRTGLLLGFEPVFAALFALTLGAEHPPTAWWEGAVLILMAVWFVESRA